MTLTGERSTLKVGPLSFRSPFFLASGTWGLGDSLERYFTEEEIRTYIGAFVTKGLSLEPMEGNPPPRLAETPCGLINSIGLENPGIKVFLERYYPLLKSYEVPIIFNLHGKTVEEFLALVQILKETDVRSIELNISCPNVAEGGIAFSQSPETVARLIRGVRESFSGLLVVKLSPIGPIMEVARICEEEGADALTIANTYPAMAILSYSPLSIIKGGLSGPAIKPLTLRLVYELSQKSKLPIIASGGILTGRDAFEYYLVGARAFQVGTANLIDPRAVIRIYNEFVELMERYERLSD